VWFDPGETKKAVSVRIIGDTVLEGNERFEVRLAGSAVADGVGVGTILTDDTGLAINDVSVTEGNSGSKLATFTITRSGLTTGTSSVRWSTANGTASAGSDYTAVSNALVSFAAGQTSKTVSVAIAGDTLIEPDERFYVNLSSPTGAQLTDSRGVGTIVSDDLPGLSINDISVAEGDSGSTLATFTITRSTTGITSSVAWALALTGSANKLDVLDPTAKGTVSFAAGEATKTVSVAVRGDTAEEPRETFSVNLSSPVQATIIDGTGIATIVNDD